MNFASDEFRQKAAKGVAAIAENDGPYLIHCTEGKDRTGFMCILLREVMLKHGFKPLVEEWWHFTLKNEPYPDTYFTFPINSNSLK